MGRIQVPPDHLRKVAQKFHNEHVRLSDELNRLNTSLSSVMLGLEGHSVERFRYEYREAENRMNMILAVIQNTAKELERIVILFTDADSGEVHLPDTPQEAWRMLTHRTEQTWDYLTETVRENWELMKHKAVVEAELEREKMAVATEELDEALEYFNYALSNPDQYPLFGLHCVGLREYFNDYSATDDKLGSRDYWLSRGYDAEGIHEVADKLKTPIDDETFLTLNNQYMQHDAELKAGAMFGVATSAILSKGGGMKGNLIGTNVMQKININNSNNGNSGIRKVTVPREWAEKKLAKHIDPWKSSFGQPGDGYGQLVKDLPKWHPMRTKFARMLSEVRSSGGTIRKADMGPTYAVFGGNSIEEGVWFRWNPSKLRSVDMLEEINHWQQYKNGLQKAGYSPEDLEIMAKRAIINKYPLDINLKKELLHDIKRVKNGEYIQ